MLRARFRMSSASEAFSRQFSGGGCKDSQGEKTEDNDMFHLF